MTCSLLHTGLIPNRQRPPILLTVLLLRCVAWCAASLFDEHLACYSARLSLQASLSRWLQLLQRHIWQVTYCEWCSPHRNKQHAIFLLAFIAFLTEVGARLSDVPNSMVPHTRLPGAH